MNTITSTKYVVSAALLAVLIAVPMASAGAYYYPTTQHLYIPGVDGEAQNGYNGAVPTPKPVHLNFDVFGNPDANNTTASSSTSSNTGLFGGLFGSSSATAHDAAGHQITLVTDDNVNVYAIIGGKKHLIPAIPEILAEYNYQVSLVQLISSNQLAKYPRATLLSVKGDSKHVYYLTENGMVRLMPNEKVINSYGGRLEDAIVVSKVEFNFYPTNQYIYLENPMNRDVFQVIGGKEKRYLTPMAVMRLGLTNDQVAPVSQYEMDSYKISAPVIQ
jgi:hypothetical protein